ncbi:gamma-glutamyl-gamma-aminobutyrate hydrolase family protein [Bradyrhizobium sp. RT11b]|uniref:gamma-glutamyl-gamma-aminobutyrate hydrolase family protein n=1 Tax=Bradyrhizobium sp. RT11b TaxID=3156332 RepID=UPI0033971BF5
MGIVSNFDTNRHLYTCRPTYAAAVEAAGGVPIIVPYLESEASLDGLLDTCDGILLSGGGDLHPRYYGEELTSEIGPIIAERDEFEAALAQRILSEQVPTLGICRGMQWLGVAAGGSLIGHIPSAKPGANDHCQEQRLEQPVHDVVIENGSLLSRILGCTRLGVNTWHHQAVAKVPSGFRCAAHSPDGVIEAIESETAPFIVGVQWHPESLFFASPENANIFRAFVGACRQQHEDRS